MTASGVSEPPRYTLCYIRVMTFEETERRLLAEIRDRREQMEWTRDDVSERLAEVGIQISGATWAKVEYGARKLKTEELYAVADVLNIDLDGVRPGRQLSPASAVEQLASTQYEDIERQVRQLGRVMTRARSGRKLARTLRAAIEDDAVRVRVGQEGMRWLVEDMLNDKRYPTEGWLRALGVAEADINAFLEATDQPEVSSIAQRDEMILTAIDRVIDRIHEADNGVTVLT